MTGVVVFLQEEYGYRHWIWETGLDADTLRAYWRHLRRRAKKNHGMTLRWDFGVRSLVGRVTEIDPPLGYRLDPTWWTGHIHELEDSFLKPPKTVVEETPEETRDRLAHNAAAYVDPDGLNADFADQAFGRVGLVWEIVDPNAN